MKPKPWRKKLFGNENYPDNYTDETFLQELRKNVYFEAVPLLVAVKGAAVVVNELCTVILFVIHYVYLYNRWINSSVVFVYSSIVAFFGYLFYIVHSKRVMRRTIGSHLRTLFIHMIFGQLFSPLLYTLTDSISTDTIYVTTFFMMLIHLIFYDYGVDAAIVSNGLSISAAIFGSICLSSRLASPHEAFVLMTFSIECFILFPFFKARFQNSLLITVCLVVLDLVILWCVSKVMFALLFFCLLFINGYCPYLFIKYQHHKDNIYGPWDEAVISDKKDE